MHFIDLLIILAYFTILIWVGVFSQKLNNQTSENFILSGRRLSFLSFIATLVTTWYGAILGIGENTYLYGIQTWFIFSLPYYIFATIYAFFIAPKIRESGYLSIPDHFNKHFGKVSGILSAILIILLASPAPYILSMGILIQYFFQFNIGISLIIATLFSVIYLWNGGFSSVVKTDFFQFFCMFLSFFILLNFLRNNLGNPYEMFLKLPNQYTNPLGGNTLQYVLVWFFIAAWTFIDPGFFQRCAAAKTPKIARNGILIAIGFWAIFDTITIFCGLYAIEYLKTDQPLLTYPLLAIDFLPVGFLGFFLIGIFAIIMSTIDSLSFISAITFGRDILWRIKSEKENKEYIVPFIRLGLIVISIISLLLAYFIPSVVKLLFTLGSIIIPALILPFIISLIFSDIQINEIEAIFWIIIPLIISIFWLFLSKYTGVNFLKIEPFYPGMISSFLYFISIKRGYRWQLK